MIFSFRSPLHFVNIAAPLVPIFMLVFISVAESFPKYLPDFFVSISKRYNDFTCVRELTAVIIVLTIGLSNVIDEVSHNLSYCIALNYINYIDLIFI